MNHRHATIRRPKASLAGPCKVRRRSALAILGACLLGWCLVGLSPEKVLAQSGDAVINREHTLKALFLYNFGSYVEWPSSAFDGEAQPFVIGILGASPVESTLQEIAATRRIDGRQIVVKRFAEATALTQCQILFITDSVSRQSQQAAVAQLQGREVLIVGETHGFAMHGAVVNFYIESNKIRFEINVDAAKRHHLKISSKLLALAKIVGATATSLERVP